MLGSIVHRWYVSALSSVVLVACVPVDSPADAELKKALVGTWNVQYQTSSEQLVRGVVTLRGDGTFFELETVGDGVGSEKTHYSGPWYVTEGLLKLNGQKINGQGVGVGSMTFFTCKLGAVSSKGFACKDNVANKTYTFASEENS